MIIRRFVISMLVCGFATSLFTGRPSTAAERYYDKASCAQDWQFADFPDEENFVARHQGFVSVLIYASATGQIDDVKVVSNTGDPALVQDVLKGVRKFSHTVPASCEGSKVASVSPYTLKVSRGQRDK